MDSATDGVFTGEAPPLVISSYTLGTEVSFAGRVAAAAAAGFDGIGLLAENYWDARNAGLSDDDMNALADQHGVRPHLRGEALEHRPAGEAPPRRHHPCLCRVVRAGRR